MTFSVGMSVIYEGESGILAYVGNEYIVIEIETARLCVYCRDWKKIII